MVFVEINRHGFTRDSALGIELSQGIHGLGWYYCARFTIYDRIMYYKIRGWPCFIFFKIARNSKFQVNLNSEIIAVEIDDKSPSNILENFVYKFSSQGVERVTDRMTYYEMLKRMCFDKDTWIFHPPISHKIKDREKWFTSQIQSLKGNELPMCWTNYDVHSIIFFYE